MNDTAYSAYSMRYWNAACGNSTFVLKLSCDFCKVKKNIKQLNSNLQEGDEGSAAGQCAGSRGRVSPAVPPRLAAENQSIPAEKASKLPWDQLSTSDRWPPITH